jgi:phage terminase small subunit
MTLTSKKARFVEEFLVDLNGRQAAIRAGYSPKTAEVQASRLLRNAKVEAAVKEAVEARSRRTQITADLVILELAKLAFSNISDFLQVHCDGSVSVDLSRATRDKTTAIRDIIVRGCADNSTEEGRRVSLRGIALFDKLKALNMLARHLGMFPMKEEACVSRPAEKRYSGSVSGCGRCSAVGRYTSARQ